MLLEFRCLLFRYGGYGVLHGQYNVEGSERSEFVVLEVQDTLFGILVNVNDADTVWLTIELAHFLLIILLRLGQLFLSVPPADDRLRIEFLIAIALETRIGTIGFFLRLEDEGVFKDHGGHLDGIEPGPEKDGEVIHVLIEVLPKSLCPLLILHTHFFLDAFADLVFLLLHLSTKLFTGEVREANTRLLHLLLHLRFTLFIKDAPETCNDVFAFVLHVQYNVEGCGRSEVHQVNFHFVFGISLAQSKQAKKFRSHFQNLTVWFQPFACLHENFSHSVPTKIKSSFSKIMGEQVSFVDLSDHFLFRPDESRLHSIKIRIAAFVRKVRLVTHRLKVQ